jgi:hypothetical protein
MTLLFNILLSQPMQMSAVSEGNSKWLVCLERQTNLTIFSQFHLLMMGNMASRQNKSESDSRTGDISSMSEGYE